MKKINMFLIKRQISNSLQNDLYNQFKRKNDVMKRKEEKVFEMLFVGIHNSHISKTFFQLRQS